MFNDNLLQSWQNVDSLVLLTPGETEKKGVENVKHIGAEGYMKQWEILIRFTAVKL